MEKMKKTAKVLDVCFRICTCICYVAGFFLLVAICAILLEPLTGNHDVTLQESLELGNVTFELAPRAYQEGGMGYMLSIMLLGVGAVVFMVIMTKLIRKILKPMVEGLPFHESIGTNLKKLGWLEIIAGVLMNGMTAVEYWMTARNFDLTELFVGDKITAVTVNYMFDFSFLMPAAVFFLASYIFRYGAQLQQLSDETL